MDTINFSKFRFRVGDTVLYQGEEYKVLGYYFSEGFNNYNEVYGYVIDYPMHDSSLYSYDQYGNKLKLKGACSFYVIERHLSFVKHASYIDIYNIRPGDRVKILPRTEYWGDYTYAYVDGMLNYIGTIQTVKSVKYLKDSDKDIIVCKVEENNYNWTNRMFKIIQPDMEQKQMKINIPEGYEIDRENSTFECIKFKKKKLTFDEIERQSVGNRYLEYYHLTDSQLVKIHAFYKLLTVADYLNNRYTEKDDLHHYCIIINNGRIMVSSFRSCIDASPICFRTPELARQAIDILGEETIKSALL